jgi:hypothetical protein
MSSYSQITPAHDWYFRHDTQDGKPILYPVAVWALKADETGKSTVIGLIAPIFNQKDIDRVLHEPPPILGYYIHREQLNEEELRQIQRR